MKLYVFLFAGIFLLTTTASAQEAKTLSLTTQEIEAIFIEQNLQLIAEKMNISIADASIAQAKLWDNPTLSIGNTNLWSTSAQREGEAEVIPPLFGSFGRNMEFSVELSQLIQMANKRGKLVKREKVSKEISIRQFEDVLRGLKAELRKAMDEAIYLKSYLRVLDAQSQSLTKLVESYNKQMARGNMAKSEVLRLQSALFDVESEKNEVQMVANSQQKTLKSLLNMTPTVAIDIIEKDGRVWQPNGLSLSQLIATASDYRPDLKMNQLQTHYFEKSLAYEKSLAVPDITLSAAYDRRGGVWKDFIGFGVSVDLPFFNRNQGGTKAAKIGRDQSIFLANQQQNLAEHEIMEALSNYTSAYDFYQKMTTNPLLAELDAIQEVYAANLLNRNISMVEYLDFLDAYKSNKQSFLTVRKNLLIQLEELQYAVGTDLTTTEIKE